MMFIIDDLLLVPFKGLYWVGKEIHKAVLTEQVSQREAITTTLSELYMNWRRGALTRRSSMPAKPSCSMPWIGSGSRLRTRRSERPRAAPTRRPTPAVLRRQRGSWQDHLHPGGGAAFSREYPDAPLLLISTDPAHSLADCLTGESPLPNLHVEEPDAAADLAAFRARRGTFLDDSDIDRFLSLSLPGLDELMAVLELGRQVSAGRCYRTILVDTAPQRPHPAPACWPYRRPCAGGWSCWTP